MSKDWGEIFIIKPLLFLLGLYVCGEVLAAFLHVPQNLFGVLLAAAGGVTMLGGYYRTHLSGS